MPKLFNAEALDELLSIKKGYRHVFTDFKKYLTEESNMLFDSLNIHPNVLILFGHTNNSQQSNFSPIVHTDVIRENNILVKVPFAINYELFESNSIMKWFNINSATEIYPTTYPIDQINSENSKNDYIYGSGIHYDSFRNKDSTNYTCLESCQLPVNKQILFRNDIPHAAFYPAGCETRISASIRFPLDEIKSYEEAVSIFGTPDRV